jgi:HEPN domain-containing protein
MDEKPDTRLLVRQWLEKAGHDRGIAETLMIQQSPYTDGICFHCQQAVEKMLKAALIARGIPFKRNHNLAYLADLLSEEAAIPDAFRDDLEHLEDYAVEVRYPDAMVEPTATDAQEAVSIVNTAPHFVNEVLGQ